MAKSARGSRTRSRDVHSSLDPKSEAARRPRGRSGVHVEATAKGFYGGNRIRPGDRFELEDEIHFSPKWMKKVGEARTFDVPTKPTPSGSSSSGSGVL